MMLWISDLEPPSWSSSLVYLLSSSAPSDLDGDGSSDRWDLAAAEGLRDGGCEVMGVAGVGSM
jgi:hypothetical protein